MRTALQFLFPWALALSAFGEQQLVDSRTAGRYLVSVTCAPFDAQRDGLGRNQYQSATLHGSFIYGTDGDVPQTVIRSVSLSIGAQSYSLPTELHRDLADPHLGPTFYRRTFTVSETRRYVIITLSGGDGASGYSCRWRISKSHLDASRSVRSHPMQDFPPDEPAQRLIPIAKAHNA